MICYIIDTLSGLFAVDDSGNIINFMDFEDNNQNIVNFYKSIEEERLLEEISDFFKELDSSGFKEFIFDNKSLRRLIKLNLKYDTILNEFSSEFKNFRFNLKDKLSNIGIQVTRNDIVLKHKNVSEELIRTQVSQMGEQGDIAVIQIIETLDTLKKSISLFSARLREWYGLYFPELTDKIIEDNILIAKFVDILGHRNNYTAEKLKLNFELSERRINYLVQSALNSMGADIDLDIVCEYAKQILMIDSFREELEANLDEIMEKIAPNLRAVVGSLIGAKLITKAGSLKKLSFMPASRIQLLGAETALYRFLKTGKGIPKHGLIFQWNIIRGSKSYLRGKISRVVSGKIGLAAKIDFFKGGFHGDEISNDLMKKIKEIEVKYPNPPKNKKKSSGKKKRKINHKKRKT
ncbi:MAG: hypothetical protein ACFFAS_08215 [Promethearchaeota archaeon]